MGDSKDSLDDLRSRIEGASGVPIDQQELRFSNGEALTAGGSQLEAEGSEVPTVWLTRSSEKTGSEGDDEDGGWFLPVVRGILLTVLLGTAFAVYSYLQQKPTEGA